MGNKVFLILLFTVSCSVIMARDIYVSVNGNDMNQGSANSPYKLSTKRPKKLYPVM